MAAATEVMPSVGVSVKQGFAERELMLSAERAAVAQAAKAKAEVESRFVMAMQNRRDWDNVRISLLHECERLDFARECWYRVPNRGEGFSIRFAEAAISHMGNIYTSAPVIVEDDYQRTVCVTVLDLERNITYTKDIVVSKTVERKSPEGREVIRFRQKADGGSIAIVRATDEELLSKENSLVSKTLRTGVIRIVPPDLKAECKARIAATIKAGDAADPDGERKKIADAFADVGVKPSDLKEYFGCELDQFQPAEFQTLRELYTALKEGHVSWRELIAQKRAEKQDGDPLEKPAPSPLKDRVKKAAEKKEPVREYDGWDDPNRPDPMNVPIGHQIYVKLPEGTKLYACNAQQSGWIEVVAEKSAGK